MHKDTIQYLFESDQVTGYLTLQKLEMSDDQFLKLLAVKPSELNTVIARVASFIKEDETQKTKKDLINDILEVLERSTAARQFVSVGVQQNYQLFKGFPVRKGDPYDHMPEPSTELVLKPSELYIGWTTDGSKAREDAVKYDVSKGDPIGGLLVDVNVDVTKLLFDVNAVIRTIKSKYKLIEQYNAQAAPGKALSKTNTHFLATEAPVYSGRWEIVTTNKVVNVRIVDKWTWDSTTGEKKIKWIADDKTTPEQEPVEDSTPAKPEVVPQEQPQQEQPPAEPQQPEQAKKLQERIMRLFESEEKLSKDELIPVYEELIDEDAWQGMKNFLASTFGTMRGKKMKFLETLSRFYSTEMEVYKIAKEFATLVDKDTKRADYAQGKIDATEKRIEDIKTVMSEIKSGADIDVPMFGVGDSGEQQQPPFDASKQTPAEKQVDKQHQEMKDLKAGKTLSKSEQDFLNNPPIPGKGF